jgi:hypothetical protein
MITYTKLKSGEWGLRVQGSVESGRRVTVTKKSGESKTEIVGKVIWSGNGISLCTIASHRNNASRRDYQGKMCPVCDSEPLDASLRCWECGYHGH